MNYVKDFALFWYRFIIGDDWVGASVIFVGFIGTYELVRANVNAYWFLPLAVLISLSISLFRLAAKRKGQRSER